MKRQRNWLLLAAVAAGLLAVPGVQAQEAARAARVKVVRNVPYYEGDGADDVRHRLDIYIPEGKSNFPVVFFVHGGAWRHGEKNHFGIYESLARSLAESGIGTVSINYRLTPQVRHPGHIEDVAKAFAWTHKNIAGYGGDPREIFVCGHSAGGHLVALLATDGRYLKAEGLSLAAIRGAIPLSGVYVITDFKAFTSVFGTGAEVLRGASPMTHVAGDVPPFLILYAESEMPGCDGKVAEAFCRALTKAGASAQSMEAKGANHLTIMMEAVRPTELVHRKIRDFILSHVTLDRLAEDGGRGVDALLSAVRVPPE